LLIVRSFAQQKLLVAEEPVRRFGVYAHCKEVDGLTLLPLQANQWLGIGPNNRPHYAKTSYNITQACLFRPIAFDTPSIRV
jgi:hypothetical protein